MDAMKSFMSNHMQAVSNCQTSFALSRMWPRWQSDMSLWQKVLPLNPGMFVYSYLFSSYYSYTKLWLLLFSMHWWVVKVKIGSFGHQALD